MKKFLSTILSFIMVIATTYNVMAEDILSINCEISNSDLQIGDEFYADFKVTSNPCGYNSMTSYLKYNPKVLKAVPCEIKDIPSDLIIYTNERGVNFSLFSFGFVNSRINFVPKYGDKDYDGYADSTKTASEIGIIKLPSYLGASSNNFLQNYQGTGTILRMKFEVIGEGSSSIDLVGNHTAYFVNGKSYDLNVDVKNGWISTIKYGDVDNNGVVNRTDLICLGKYFAGWDVEIDPVKSDIDGNGTISRTDLIQLGKYFAGWDITLGH